MRTDAVTATRGAVLVAVDASPESLVALEWAVDYAEIRSLSITIITAVSANPRPTSDSAGSYVAMFDGAESRNRRRVQDAITTRLGSRSTRYHHVIGLGSIENVLRRHCSGAHLVVVGTRQQSRWQQWWRRSATNRLTGSLDCPVLSITDSDTSSTTSQHWPTVVANNPVSEHQHAVVAAGSSPAPRSRELLVA